MNVISATFEINEKEMRIFIFALKHNLEDTMKGHIKSVSDNNVEAHRIFFDQNKKELKMLKECNIFGYDLHEDILFQFNKLYPLEEKTKK